MKSGCRSFNCQRIFNYGCRCTFLIYKPFLFLISDPISSYPSWEDQVDVQCKKGVCECDSAAAFCFSQAHYNSSFVNYDTSNVRPERRSIDNAFSCLEEGEGKSTAGKITRTADK